MSYLMAIDAGTGSIRSIIFDTKGNQIAIAQKEWEHIGEENVPHSMTFDFKKNWELVKLCIQESIANAKIQAKDILAVSATSMREGILLYDKNGKELWGVANVDARASEEVKYLNKTYPTFEEEFYKESGQTFALGALPRILWLKNNKPEIYEKVAKISMIGDWVLAKLCGIISTDPSNAGTTGVFSLKKRTWSKNMASKVGIKNDIFCDVFEVGTPIGFVTHQASQETGLDTNTKIVTGGGDVQLGSIGLGLTNIGDVAILGGTFWQQIVNIDKNTLPPEDMSIRINPHVISNQSQAEGISFFTGLVMRWFRDAFCELEVKEAQEKGIDTYALLEEKAKKVPVGSYDIIPIFSDSMNYKKWYHAAPSFINLGIDPTIYNKGSMFRSLEENACIISAINLEKVQAFTNINIDSIVFAGGASKGDLWCQILADVTGYIVKIPNVTEATGLGAAISAGVGAGVYKDLTSASKKLVSWDKTYHPNKENHLKYQKLRKKWEKIYKTQINLVNKGLTKPMWKAPGL